MIDYTHLFRHELPIAENWQVEWDLFISAFNPTPRVCDVFTKARAGQKRWVIHPEYELSAGDLPEGDITTSNATTEDEFILDIYPEMLRGFDPAYQRLCVDCTGFLRPHLQFLFNPLVVRGFKQCDVLYSEPGYYVKREETVFSKGFVHSVRHVAGFSGVVNNDTSNDVLIIGAGYEDQLIKEVADDKERAKKLIILGLPSLRADMYQQNALRAQLAYDAVGDLGSGRFFAPANDPFSTATVLSAIVDREERFRPITICTYPPWQLKLRLLDSRYSI